MSPTSPQWNVTRHAASGKPAAGLVPIIGLLGALLAFPAASHAESAYQDLSRDISEQKDRLNRLESNLKDVEREVYSLNKRSKKFDKGSSSSSANLPADTTVRLDQLETLIRNLNGQIEAARFQNNSLNEQFQKWSGDVDYRLRAIEQKLGLSFVPEGDRPASTLGDRSQNQTPAPGANGSDGTTADASASGPATTLYTNKQGATVEVGKGLKDSQLASMGVLGQTQSSGAAPQFETPPEQSSVPTVSSVGSPEPVTVEGGQVDTTIKKVGNQAYSDPDAPLPSTPGALYQLANDRLLRRDFPGAQEAFRVFLNLYGDHARAGEAQYWLGESYYAQQDYKDAGQTFAKGLSKYPNSPKAPETLLKLGMSLQALGQTKAACKSFSEMRTRFPSVSDALALRAERERDKAGCT